MANLLRVPAQRQPTSFACMPAGPAAAEAGGLSLEVYSKALAGVDLSAMCVDMPREW